MSDRVHLEISPGGGKWQKHDYVLDTDFELSINDLLVEVSFREDGASIIVKTFADQQVEVRSLTDKIIETRITPR